MTANVVAIGGGHGLARALAALRLLEVEPTAVVTAADDGGSSGRLRRDLGIIAPGDLRMALLALARNPDLASAMAHRFGRGELQGHALGNLVLVALAERAGGDFVAALDHAAALLDCAGRVLPSTTEAVQLKAIVAGEQVEGQVSVATAHGRIERVWLEPERPAPCDAAATAIASADVVVLGPGSLFTSVLAALLVPDIGRAVVDTSAAVVQILNIHTQPGETTGFDAAAHVTALAEHVPGLVPDVVVAHDGPVAAGAAVGADLARAAVTRVVTGDLVGRDPDGRPTWGHDPGRLASALAGLLPSRG